MKKSTFIGNALLPAFLADPAAIFAGTTWRRTGRRLTTRTHIVTDGREAKEASGNGSFIEPAGAYPFIIHDGTDPAQCAHFITLYARLNSLDRDTAIVRIAQTYAIDVPQFDGNAADQLMQEAAAMNAADIKRIASLAVKESDEEEYQYLIGRGIDADSIATYAIGTIRNKREAAIMRDIIQRHRWTGITGIGTTYRLFIPTISAGKLLGVQFRALPSATDAHAKYMTIGSRQAPFGLRHPAASNSRAKTVLVVEGTFDAIAANQALAAANVTDIDAVAAAGSSLTAEQAQAIKAVGYDWVYFCPDFDGIDKYNDRRKSIDQSRAAAAANDLKLFVADIEDHDHINEKRDPNDFIVRYGTKAFIDRINDADPVVLYKLNRLAYEFGKSDPISKNTLTDHDRRQLQHIAAQYISEEDDASAAAQLYEQIDAMKSIFDNVEDATAAVEKQRQAAAAERRQQQAASLLQTAQALIRKGFWEDATPMIERVKALQPGTAAVWTAWTQPRNWEAAMEEYRKQQEGIHTGLMLQHYIGEKPEDMQEIVLPSGALTFVTAPRGHGKTKTIQNFALLLAPKAMQTQGRIIVIHYEESQGDFLNNLINITADHEFSKRNRRTIRNYMQSNSFAQDEHFEKARDVIRMYYETGTIVPISTAPTIEEIEEALAEGCKTGKIIAVMIDYVQRIRSRDKAWDRKREIADICEKLNELARDTGIPIILASQFNRTVKAPTDMTATANADASEIEQFASLNIALWSSDETPGESKTWKNEKEGILTKAADEITRAGMRFDNIGTEPGQNPPTVYIKVMKDREGERNLWNVFYFNGNIGKIKPLERKGRR